MRVYRFDDEGFGGGRRTASVALDTRTEHRLICTVETASRRTSAEESLSISRLRKRSDPTRLARIAVPFDRRTTEGNRSSLPLPSVQRSDKITARRTPCGAVFSRRSITRNTGSERRSSPLPSTPHPSTPSTNALGVLDSGCGGVERLA